MLSKLPALPSSARKSVFVSCKCGCGGSTRSTFVPGHDSRLRGWIVRIARGVVTFESMVAIHGALQGEADAVLREMIDRRLPGVKWAEIAEIEPEVPAVDSVEGLEDIAS